MSLPPDLFDTTTLISLASTVAILAAGYGLSKACLPTASSATTRFLFIWHATDALTHTLLEGSYLYHCLFSWLPVAEFLANKEVASLSELGGTDVNAANWVYFPTPEGWLGTEGRVYGAQTASGMTAGLWMVYAKADRRWGGADPATVALELLTVVFDTAVAVAVCYGLVKRKSWVYPWMIILATAELYGGWMTFCPEWLTSSLNLDTSNWLYLWVYLFFFNTVWVWIPGWIIWHSLGKISDAFVAFEGKKQE